MTAPPQSQRKRDAGRIPGPASVRNVVEVRAQVVLPNLKSTFFVVHGSFVTTPPSMQVIASALFTAISSAWGTQFAGLMTGGTQPTTFTNVYVRDMTAATNPVFVGTGPAVPGTSTSPALPPGTAAVLTENIAARGKGLKGRIYLGGWAQNADSGTGVISPATMTALTNFGISLASALNGQSLSPCVAQPARQTYIGVTGTTHPARGTPGIGSFVAVTSYAPRDNLWDVQRRRGQA